MAVRGWRLAVGSFRTDSLLPFRSSIIVLVVVIAALHGSAQAARVVIKSPTESTYLAGEVLLVATIEPASATGDVVDVTFFADGAKVCAVTAPPFECQWDAGGRIRAHQIRVVATLKDGGRLVQTITTPDLEKYVETVDVNVVPVTVVVTDVAGPPPSWSATAAHSQTAKVCDMTNGVITCT